MIFLYTEHILQQKEEEETTAFSCEGKQHRVYIKHKQIRLGNIKLLQIIGVVFKQIYPLPVPPDFIVYVRFRLQNVLATYVA